MPEPKILARACRTPSTTMINALSEEKLTLERCLIQLKLAAPKEREQMLGAIVVVNGKIDLSSCDAAKASSSRIDADLPDSTKPRDGEERRESTGSDCDSDSFQPANYLSVDERGQVEVYGPTSALHGLSPDSSAHEKSSRTNEPLRHQLIANALLQRQNEHNLLRLTTIGGEPAELALHLLDLHWNRQHHTFLLTYRPAIMRDLVTDGPYCSAFLLNAIFACVSKFSDRLEVRDNPSEPETVGKRFFSRCEELLASESLLSTSSIPTIVGLLLLGSTFNARGIASKGWLYTGYAMRMVYDLGLHLDCKAVGGNAEDVEIRRRVFWGAFICDKLNSLYLGRPFTFRSCDAHVPRDFMDTMEENELWTPYVDPKLPAHNTSLLPIVPTPIHSISTFQQLCLLSKIMAKIINKFYVVGTTVDNARTYLQVVDDSLAAWYAALPPHLIFEPWAKDSPSFSSPCPSPCPAPNILILLTTYNSLVILLHRPFVFGHLRQSSIPATSWKRCTTAARNITTIASAYQARYTLRRASYLLSYAVYVACTIHTRNTVASEELRSEDYLSALLASLRCLDELTVPNSGVLSPASNIRRLMAANGIANILDNTWDVQTPKTQELEALCQMFAPNLPNATENILMQTGNEYLPYGYDDFNGLMDILLGDVIDSKGEISGSTLTLAIQSGNMDLVDKYWHEGPEKFVNASGYVLGHTALAGTSDDVRNFLLTKVIDWDLDSGKWVSLPTKPDCFHLFLRPIHFAASNGFDAAITFLKDHNLVPDFNALTWGTEEYSPLHLAALCNKLSTIKLLRDYGADLDTNSRRDEQTPLHIAAKGGCLETVIALLEAGCSPNLTDAHGMTPELYAIESGHDEVVKILSQNLDKLEAELENVEGESSGSIIPAIGAKIWKLPLSKSPHVVDVMKVRNMTICAVRDGEGSEDIRKTLENNEGEGVFCLGKPYRRRI
ncbi:hypothetical protein IFR05_001273 [Cadophora sp. M221]|nr:hypothetical protein IFR05_001273 [Cadophora sp. M221]